VRVVAAPDRAYDIVFVCTKSSATAEVARALDPASTAVSVQNGVENPDVLRRYLPKVAGAVVYSGCRRTDAVTIEHTSNGFLVCEDEAASAFLEDHSVRCRYVADVRSWQWRKLMGNVVENSLSAILRSRVGPIHDLPELVPVIDTALAEVVAVAAADGVELADDVVREVHEGLRKLPPTNGTSTLYDLEAGRPLEVDAITGVVVRKGDQHGVPVPTVRTLDALLRFVSP
jgi:2-dehydropantoate 2-reductase